MKSTRRIGTEGSATRGVILDATEKLMLDEGYAAVSTRRVAIEAGLKHTLVHYYFPTTDDLFLAVYRRAVDKVMERLDVALAADKPLRAFWEYASDSSRTALAIEFTALANHRKVIRSEIAFHLERIRRHQTEALTALLYPGEVDPAILPPVGLAVLVAGIARVLVMEEGVGVSLGHAETRAFVDWLLSREQNRKP